MGKSRYFVKIDSIEGIIEKIKLDHPLVLYEGEDKQEAERIAARLKEGTLSEYDYDSRRVLISHHNYRGGKCSGFTVRGMSIKHPLESMVQANALSFDCHRKSLSELLGEFSNEERTFLDGLKEMATTVAAA